MKSFMAFMRTPCIRIPGNFYPGYQLYNKSGLRSNSSRKSYDIEALEKGLLHGDRSSLAKAITMIESTRNDHKKQSQTLLNRLAMKNSLLQRKLFSDGYSLRIGIAGPPGML